MGCGITIVKYLLFIFNLVFALCGLALLVVGALAFANIDKADYFMEKVNDEVNFSAPPIVLIVVGSIIFIVAFYGCCGAIRESHCMIVTFAVFLLVILIIQIAIGIVIFVKRDADGWNQALNESLTEIFNRYDDDNTRQQVDDLQRNLECCGVHGPDFWGGRIPESCCVNPDVSQCVTTHAGAHQVFQTGCVEALKELLRNFGLILGIIAIAVGVIEIIGVVFALCLASSIRNNERRA